MTEYRLIILEGETEKYELADMGMEVSVEKITVDKITGMESVDCIAAY